MNEFNTQILKLNELDVQNIKQRQVCHLNVKLTELAVKCQVIMERDN